jgi:hypothetical protein
MVSFQAWILRLSTVCEFLKAFPLVLRQSVICAGNHHNRLPHGMA